MIRFNFILGIWVYAGKMASSNCILFYQVPLCFFSMTLSICIEPPPPPRQCWYHFVCLGTLILRSHRGITGCIHSYISWLRIRCWDNYIMVAIIQMERKRRSTIWRQSTAKLVVSCMVRHRMNDRSLSEPEMTHLYWLIYALLIRKRLIYVGYRRRLWG